MRQNERMTHSPHLTVVSRVLWVINWWCYRLGLHGLSTPGF